MFSKIHDIDANTYKSKFNYLYEYMYAHLITKYAKAKDGSYLVCYQNLSIPHIWLAKSMVKF